LASYSFYFNHCIERVCNSIFLQLSQIYDTGDVLFALKGVGKIGILARRLVLLLNVEEVVTDGGNDSNGLVVCRFGSNVLIFFNCFIVEHGLRI
jgi:hypothetical protein